MKAGRAIKRMFLSLMWLGVGVGMFVLIAAAIKVQDTRLCKGIDIEIKGNKDGKLFTTQNQILNLLKAATKGEVKGQAKSGFNLPAIEDLLEQSSWVYNAELYFDNLDILRVKVKEREPLARVFTTLGASFYIDETAKQIPLSDKISLDVPVFTGYPEKKQWDHTDSIFIQNIVATASFVKEDPFWSAQVAQIDIKNCGVGCWKMEMIPVVGNHKVDLGDGTDIASKFHRLYLFYDQVLKRKGFDKYQKIDVQYAGQVIGIKSDYTRIDSLQLRKNIENLLQQSRKTNELIEIAPTVHLGNMLQADTSLEARQMYRSVEGDRDTISLLPPEADETSAIEENAQKENIKSAVKPKSLSVSPEKKKEHVVNDVQGNKIEKSEAGKKNITTTKATGNLTDAGKKNDTGKNVSGKKEMVVKKETQKPVVKSAVTPVKTISKKPEAVKKGAVKN